MALCWDSEQEKLLTPSTHNNKTRKHIDILDKAIWDGAVLDMVILDSSILLKDTLDKTFLESSMLVGSPFGMFILEDPVL